MENQQFNRLTGVQQQIATLVYQHREGGRYAYVRFLSLIRDLPVLLADSDAEGQKTLTLIANNFNERLIHTFTLREEVYFEMSRNRILRLIVKQLSNINPAPLQPASMV